MLCESLLALPKGREDMILNRKQPLRLAVLGAGEHSTSDHGPSLKHYAERNPGVIERAAICDLDPGKAHRYARQFGFDSVYTDLETMLVSESLDALIAITPLEKTFEIVIDLLPHRLPILIEKPAGIDGSENLGLHQVAQENHTRHMVSFNRRFNPAVARAREWLVEEAVGRPIRYVSARMLRHARTEATFVTGTGIHLIDNVQSFLGDPQRAQTQVQDRIWSSHVHYSGAIANLLIAPEAGVVEETYELIGSDYCVRIDTWGCQLRILDRGRTALDWTLSKDTPSFVRNGSYGETQAFLASLRSESRARPDLVDALKVMLTAEAIDAGGEKTITI